MMSFIPKRPQLPAHVSDEAAARVLSKHFGSIVEAARELGVARADLRRLTWHNPAILAAAHERMEWAISAERSEIIDGLLSSSSRVRERACDRLANPVLREAFAGAGRMLDFLIPAPRPRPRRGNPSAADGSDVLVESEPAHLVIEREVAAELDLERAAERERERESELPPATVRAPAAATASLWPAHIRRPTRGRRWR